MDKKIKILFGFFSIFLFSLLFSKPFLAEVVTIPDKINVTITNRISEKNLPVKNVEYTHDIGTEALKQFEVMMKDAGATFANDEELFKQFSERIENKDTKILKDLQNKIIEVSITNDNGQAKFEDLANDIPSKGMARKIYVILQTNTVNGITHPIIFSTPLETKDLEIQAKGEVVSRPPVSFYKWGSDNETNYDKPNNKALYHPLANAGFVIYKEDEKGLQKWLSNDGSWKDSDEDAQVFLSSVGDGIVNIAVAKLPAGTYYASEQQVPEGVDLNKNGTIDASEMWGPTVESEKLKIEIPEDFSKPVLINGIDTTKEKVRVFNILGATELPNTDEPDDGNREALPDTGKTKDNGNRTALPDTGEVICFATGLTGGALIMFALLLLYKQRKNIVNEVEMKDKQ